MLFLFGDPKLDRFGPVAASVEAVEGLAAAGRPVEHRVFAGADHSLRLVDRRGKPGKQAPVEEPLVAWLRTVTRANR